MPRQRLVIGLVAAALAVATTIGFASPAGAVTNSCASPGGISQFPNAPAGQSTLQVSCTFTNATATANAFEKVEDSPQAVWHFGAGRQVTGNTTSGSTTITLTSGSFFSTDVNHGISGFSASASLNGGTGSTALTNSALPAMAFIKSVTNATTAVLDVAATATGTGKHWTIENSDSRSFKDASTTSGSGTVTSATANFTATDVGRTITGTNMAHGAKITARTSATQVTVSPVATATGASQQLSIGPATNQTTARFVHDAHVTTGSTTVTSASAAFVAAYDVHLPVSGTGIPAGASIASVTNATTVVLSAAATATSTTGSLTIGLPNATAPINGDTTMALGAELALNPTLVAGSAPCSANAPTGFDITGAWESPNAYATGAFAKPTSASLTKPTIGEFAVPTAVVTFGGFVEQVPASTSGESQTAAHYDVVFPDLPTSLAICPTATAGVASTFEFLGTAHSQSGLPTGVGTPSTSQVRALKDITASPTTSSVFYHVRTNDTATSDSFSFSQACTEQYPDLSDFGCGIG